MNRIQNLDMLRGSAAFAVLLAHATLLGQGSIAPVVSGVSSLLVHLGSTAVWFFFIISGYVIGRPFVRRLLAGDPLPDGRSFALRRTTRIYPLYWVCVLVILVLGAGWGTADVRHRIAHVLLLHNLFPGRQQGFIPVSWTLTLEILFYVAVGVGAFVLHRALRARPMPADHLAGLLAAVWAAAIGVLAVAPLLVEDPVRQLWVRQSFLTMMGMFVPGLLIATAECADPDTVSGRIWTAIRSHRRRLLPAGVAACAVGAWLASAPLGTDGDAGLVVWDLSRHGYAVGYGLIVAWALLVDAWSFTGTGVLRYLGDRSYGVYLIHGVVLGVLLAHPEWIPLARPGITTYLFHVVLLASVTVPAAHVSWALLERPVIAWSRSATADRRPAAPADQW